MYVPADETYIPTDETYVSSAGTKNLQQQKNFSAVVKKQIYSYRTRNLPAETEQHNGIGRNIHV